MSTPFWSMGWRHQFGARLGVPSVNNIQELRERRGWMRPEMARRMDTSPQQVERLEKSQRKLSLDWIDKAAEALSVEPWQIIVPLDDEGPKGQAHGMPPAPANDDDTAEIIALDLSLSMGPGTFIEDFVDGEPVRMSLGFIQAITRTPTDRLRLVKGIGDSMEPTLRTGDQVLVDINERQLSRINGIYWIDYLGMHGIKRLRAAGQGRLHIGSDNPLVPDFEVDAADVRIEGRVIWFAREL